ncbi:hypothetical protein BAE44_0011490 [Dichanthelium oligosanthes]|uniref:Uncharacterized protein n=1 Tax=Dichanthelium oligosanthes TaxID=888268 RepID=A0A1E5VQU9_9POAL|nr:hypothetical protein BAE44_0011490 [Dichanthelium oligosanthes]
MKPVIELASSLMEAGQPQAHNAQGGREPAMKLLFMEMGIS